jgi:hypothetical protein
MCVFPPSSSFFSPILTFSSPVPPEAALLEVALLVSPLQTASRSDGRKRSSRAFPPSTHFPLHLLNLRPCSVFYLYRLSGDRKWQDVGWTMFVNWVKHSITEAGLFVLLSCLFLSPIT